MKPNRQYFKADRDAVSGPTSEPLRPLLGIATGLLLGASILAGVGGCNSGQNSGVEDSVASASTPKPGGDSPAAPGAASEGEKGKGKETARPSPSSTAEPPGKAPEGMVWIPPGEFWMGEDDESMRDAKPVHRVKLDGFWMDRHEVTNEQFAQFVRETGYVTVAERKPDPKDFPDAPPELLVPGSIVFTPPSEPVPLTNHLVWWRYVPGADWRHPEGPGSSIEGREKHPVVHVCWDDAMAYCKWAGKRLPTEAEWEYAARGGLERKRYVWGNDLTPNGKWMVNNWQGQFPSENTALDGFTRTAPVGTYEPNGYGLYDMAGNVWEWCADWYQPSYPAHEETPNPQGPDSSHDPAEPGVPKRVQRGGSFLCSDLYCTRYLPGARGKGAPDSGASHVGFRCVKSPDPLPERH